MGRTDPKAVVGQLAAEGLEVFTVADLGERLHLDRHQAAGLAQRLTRQNLVRRVKRGLYAILQPADWHGEAPLTLDPYWVAACTVRGEPHFLAYYTAMELNGMLQHPLSTVTVAVTTQHRPLTFGTFRFRFVTISAGRLFGTEERRTTLGHVVRVAQLERTLLDCVDRPDLCGGIEEVFRGFVRRQPDIDPDRLLRFVLRLDRPVVTKRLGMLLELAGGDPELLLEIEQAAGRLGRYVPLDKGAPAGTAERNRRWELIVNTDLPRLFAAARS